MKSNVEVQYLDTHIEITFGNTAGNALPSSSLSQLTQAIKECDNATQNVILLKSDGDRTFCAGASFDELTQIKDKESGLTFFSGFGNVINAMRTSKKIIITRVQGKAVGGGVGLIAASDFVVATKFASIRLSELAVGIGPFVIGPAVERKVGNAAFGMMALTPDQWQTAQWGKEKNLLTEVFDDLEQVDNYIDFLIKKWNGYSPEALYEIKKVMWEGTEHWDELLQTRAAISGRLVLSEYTRNAIAAFKMA